MKSYVLNPGSALSKLKILCTTLPHAGQTFPRLHTMSNEQLRTISKKFETIGGKDNFQNFGIKVFFFVDNKRAHRASAR